MFPNFWSFLLNLCGNQNNLIAERLCSSARAHLKAGASKSHNWFKTKTVWTLIYIPVFKLCWWTSKTSNDKKKNVCILFSCILLSHLVQEKRSKWPTVRKASQKRKKKNYPFSIGGKIRHVNQSVNSDNKMHLVAEKRISFWSDHNPTKADWSSACSRRTSKWENKNESLNKILKQLVRS